MDDTRMTELLILLGILAALTVLVVVFVMRWWRGPARKLSRVVRAIGSDSLVDVIIPDGMGGEIQLDHLLLTSGGLLLLELKDVDGTVFAGDTLDEWTALQGQTRTTFLNPIPVLGGPGCRLAGDRAGGADIGKGGLYGERRISEGPSRRGDDAR